MRTAITAFAFASLLAVSALAQTPPLVNGTIKKVDTAQGKLTVDHGPIKNLDMDAMTMVFRAGDPEMLKTVKAGDKIKFTAERVNGQITVTKIQK
ncbi:copper-binding protein [Bosea rubneri]|uniref:Copper-binding protein n=1 Tax=Bosea rubneri TaxID=3075434 RepID=A0ABU3SAG0_9HYPH|nr:copper-binding protein [Bosea sp. ZW T0_25]MDU0341774.1 copper-binding protein [Bosea sp. ZW T0_25]